MDEISGHVIVKMIDNEGQHTVVLKLKFVRNCASLDVTNNTQETVIFNPNQMLGVLDLRSLGYYKIKQGVLQQNLSKCYHFESVEKLCEEFNVIVNERKKEEEREVDKDKYPWLDDSDERKYMTDREILEKHINLDNSCLTESEKTQVRDMIFEYREAFSLRDEIGTCPNIEIDIDVTDKRPFFIRPYHVKEEDKRILDKEMKRLCYLGILKEGFSAYSSPVMLISRKLTQDKRVVTDFRHLNTRIAKNNLAYPLVKDTFTTLGNSKCEVLSVLDLKDAFHSLRLSEKSKKYCGILPYFGSASYLYQRMPMGLNVSPPIWQSYINTILNCLESRKYYEAIMDDLLLFMPSKQMHMRKLEDLLKALLKNGLKISPRKCQLFKTELQYMGNTIFIQGKRVCVKPLHSRLEAIQKLEPPKTVKGCRSFAGMVNFLSIFCQDLQKLLKPIYDLTRKGRPFLWQQEQQTAFEIKSRLLTILHLPDGKGRFHLYSDTSKYAMGSALYQIQNGKPKLIAYASKRLPEAARNYSITELEMCGLAINITSFAHLLKKVDFDVIVDHLSLVHILKSKTEPATPRIKRLLEVLSAYSFNLYYMKGKDMILSDFLSRQEIDKCDPHEIIPILFDMNAILNDRYYNVEEEEEESKYLVQTHSQTKDSGIKVPEVHGTKKGVDPNLRPEWLVRKSQKLMERSRIEQKKADFPKQKNQVIDQIGSGQRKEIRKPQIEQGRENIPRQGYDPQEPKIPIFPNQIAKPIPSLTEKVTQDDRQADLELDLEINKKNLRKIHHIRKE